MCSNRLDIGCKSQGNATAFVSNTWKNEDIVLCEINGVSLVGGETRIPFQTF